MNIRIRAFVAVMVALVALPVIAFEPPKHYFIGRVCRGAKELPEWTAGEQPCAHPLRDAVVTFRNSEGQLVVVNTATDGSYATAPMALNGSEADSVTFEAPDHVGIRITPLTYVVGAPVGQRVAVTVFLPRQHAVKVTVH